MRKRYYSRRRKRRYGRRKSKKKYFVIASVLIALAVGGFFVIKSVTDAQPSSQLAALTAPEAAGSTADESSPTMQPTPTPEPLLYEDIEPSKTDKTDPAKFNFETNIFVDKVKTDSYTRTDPIYFGSGEDYTALEGVTTYRGNNYRDTASSYGTADITKETLTLLDIDKDTGSIGKWQGSACTGQPLIVTWPDKTRKNMTALYDDFRSKKDFTEVIIASVDGSIYFMELSTGEKTRDPIKIGAPTKGTPSLDPRGYPIIYVGQGLNPNGSSSKSNDMYFRAYSLIDGELLFKFGAPNKDPDAYRNWQAYDASPLIHGRTDTLIEPGENGVLYAVKLNTVYDEEEGTVTMNPDPMVKYTYQSARNEQTGIYGMENSPVAWRNYLFFTDNIGMLQCVDLNTMELVYANDLENDSDVSMVLEEDTADQKFYLYTGSEYDDTVVDAKSTTGSSYARKIDGFTGEILWSTPFTVYTEIDGDVDNGILASPILGKEGTSLEGLIIYTISGMIMEDDSKTTKLIALDKETGKIVWQVDMENDGWTPSSPAAVYTEDGQGYIVQCLYKGGIKLIRADKDTAVVVDSINVSEELGSSEDNNFEATPAVYGNTIVVGSRSGHFFYLKID